MRRSLRRVGRSYLLCARLINDKWRLYYFSFCNNDEQVNLNNSIIQFRPTFFHINFSVYFLHSRFNPLNLMNTLYLCNNKSQNWIPRIFSLPLQLKISIFLISKPRRHFIKFCISFWSLPLKWKIQNPSIRPINCFLSNPFEIYFKFHLHAIEILAITITVLQLRSSISTSKRVTSVNQFRGRWRYVSRMEYQWKGAQCRLSTIIVSLS